MKGIASISGALLLGVIMISAAFLVQDENMNENAAMTAEEAAVVASAERLREYQPTKDSDGDGISDWKEVLEGTDPNTPNDPEETYEGPDQIVEELTERARNTTSTSSAPDTFTEQFARAYTEDYIRTKHNAGNDPEAADDALVERAVSSIQKNVTHSTYSPNDLSIIRDSDMSDVRTYGNQLGAILNTNLIPGNLDPHSIILKAIEDEDPEVLQLLTVYINAFAYLRDEIHALSVPHTLVQEHLVLLNTFSTIHDDFVSVQDQTFEDPLLGYGHLLSLTENLNTMTDSIIPLRNKLEENDIYYTREEAGTKIFDF